MDVVELICSLCTEEAEMGGSEVQVHPQLQGEFKAILGNTTPCLKIKPKPKQQKKHQRLASLWSHHHSSDSTPFLNIHVFLTLRAYLVT